MEKSRRDFFKKGLMGSLVLGTASLSHSAKAVTSMVESKRAKRVLMISLDGICVEGFFESPYTSSRCLVGRRRIVFTDTCSDAISHFA